MIGFRLTIVAIGLGGVLLSSSFALSTPSKNQEEVERLYHELQFDLISTQYKASELLAIGEFLDEVEVREALTNVQNQERFTKGTGIGDRIATEFNAAVNLRIRRHAWAVKDFMERAAVRNAMRQRVNDLGESIADAIIQLRKNPPEGIKPEWITKWGEVWFASSNAFNELGELVDPNFNPVFPKRLPTLPEIEANTSLEDLSTYWFAAARALARLKKFDDAETIWGKRFLDEALTVALTKLTAPDVLDAVDNAATWKLREEMQEELTSSHFEGDIAATIENAVTKRHELERRRVAFRHIARAMLFGHDLITQAQVQSAYDEMIRMENPAGSYWRFFSDRKNESVRQGINQGIFFVVLPGTIAGVAGRLAMMGAKTITRAVLFKTLGEAAALSARGVLAGQVAGFTVGLGFEGMTFHTATATIQTPLVGSAAWNHYRRGVAESTLMLGSIRLGKWAFDTGALNTIAKSRGIDVEKWWKPPKIFPLSKGMKAGLYTGELVTEGFSFASVGRLERAIKNARSGKDTEDEAFWSAWAESMQTVVELRIAGGLVKAGGKLYSASRAKVQTPVSPSPPDLPVDVAMPIAVGENRRAVATPPKGGSKPAFTLIQGGLNERATTRESDQNSSGPKDPVEGKVESGGREEKRERPETLRVAPVPGDQIVFEVQIEHGPKLHLRLPRPYFLEGERPMTKVEIEAALRLIGETLNRIAKDKDNGQPFNVMADIGKTIIDTRSVAIKIFQEVDQKEGKSYFSIVNLHRLPLTTEEMLNAQGVPTEVRAAYREAYDANKFQPAYRSQAAAVDGASEFFLQLKMLGASIQYVSGSDQVAHQGTRDLIRKHGFPDEIIQLLPKETENFRPPSTLDFKMREVEDTIHKGRLLIFDDDLGILKAIRQRFPTAICVWMDTGEAMIGNREKVPEGIIRLRSFPKIEGFEYVKIKGSDGMVWKLPLSPWLRQQIANGMSHDDILKHRRDTRTGLLDAAAWEEVRKAEELWKSRPDRVVVSYDVVGLRTLNKRYGEIGGDHALETVARMIQKWLPGSLNARRGGDEFRSRVKNGTEPEDTKLRVEMALEDYRLQTIEGRNSRGESVSFHPEGFRAAISRVEDDARDWAARKEKEGPVIELIGELKNTEVASLPRWWDRKWRKSRPLPTEETRKVLFNEGFTLTSTWLGILVRDRTGDIDEVTFLNPGASSSAETEVYKYKRNQINGRQALFDTLARNEVVPFSAGRVYVNREGIHKIYIPKQETPYGTREAFWVGRGGTAHIYWLPQSPIGEGDAILKVFRNAQHLDTYAQPLIEVAAEKLFNSIVPSFPDVLDYSAHHILMTIRFGHELNWHWLNKIPIKGSGEMAKIRQIYDAQKAVGVVYSDSPLANTVKDSKGELGFIDPGLFIKVREDSPMRLRWESTLKEVGAPTTEAKRTIVTKEEFDSAVEDMEAGLAEAMRKMIDIGSPYEVFVNEKLPTGPHPNVREMIDQYRRMAGSETGSTSAKLPEELVQKERLDFFNIWMPSALEEVRLAAKRTRINRKALERAFLKFVFIRPLKVNGKDFDPWMREQWGPTITQPGRLCRAFIDLAVYTIRSGQIESLNEEFKIKVSPKKAAEWKGSAPRSSVGQDSSGAVAPQPLPIREINGVKMGAPKGWVRWKGELIPVYEDSSSDSKNKYQFRVMKEGARDWKELYDKRIADMKAVGIAMPEEKGSQIDKGLMRLRYEVGMHRFDAKLFPDGHYEIVKASEFKNNMPPEQFEAIDRPLRALAKNKKLVTDLFSLFATNGHLELIWARGKRGGHWVIKADGRALDLKTDNPSEIHAAQNGVSHSASSVFSLAGDLLRSDASNRQEFLKLVKPFVESSVKAKRELVSVNIVERDATRNDVQKLIRVIDMWHDILILVVRDKTKQVDQSRPPPELPIPVVQNEKSGVEQFLASMPVLRAQQAEAIKLIHAILKDSRVPPSVKKALEELEHHLLEG